MVFWSMYQAVGMLAKRADDNPFPSGDIATSSSIYASDFSSFHRD